MKRMTVSAACVFALMVLCVGSAAAGEVISVPSRVFDFGAETAAPIPVGFGPLDTVSRPVARTLDVTADAFAEGWEQAAEVLAHDNGKRALAGLHVDAPSARGNDWTRVDRGDTSSWFISYRSVGAVMLRAHFTAMPEGRLWVSGSDGVIHAAAPTRTATTSDFWGPIVPGDTITIEWVGRGQTPPADLVDMLSHGLPTEGAEAESWCYLDPTCYTDGNSVKNGVGWLYLDETGGGFFCTGSLLSDTSGSGTPYLLTAHHCLSNNGDADALAVTFQYHTGTCNGSVPNVGTLDFVFGSTIRSTGATSDHTLVELDSNPPAGTTYLGWSTAALASGEDIAVVHHPDGSWKRLSYGNQVGGDTNFWTIRYTEGSTEGGSSGSPLFNNDMLVVGQLYGGDASCNRMNGTDDFGKFSRSWDLGIKNWLDNGSTTTTTHPTTTTTTHPTTTTTHPTTTTTHTGGTTTTTSGGDDDTDDDTSDDDSDDDSTDDDADDDAGDDDWHGDDDDTGDDSDDQDCGDLLTTVYSECDYTLTNNGEPMSGTEALALCEDGDDIWQCVFTCKDESNSCGDFAECAAELCGVTMNESAPATGDDDDDSGGGNCGC